MNPTRTRITTTVIATVCAALASTGAAAVVPAPQLQELVEPVEQPQSPPVGTPAPVAADGGWVRPPRGGLERPVVRPPLLVSPSAQARGPQASARAPVFTPQQQAQQHRRALEQRIVWRRSRSVGTPQNGQLVDGVTLPVEGAHFFTWDATKNQVSSPQWRRVGTDRLVRTILAVLDDYAAAHPDAPRVAIGDLSRPRGGPFGGEFGGDGHHSHQSGLDVDVYFPRRDRTERGPVSAADIDRRLSQDLVDRFVAAGAQYVFVGHNTGLRGPRDVVLEEDNHDDHAHVRIR